MADPIQTLKKEWPVIRAAPWSILTLALFFGGAGVAIGSVGKPIIDAIALRVAGKAAAKPAATASNCPQAFNPEATPPASAPPGAPPMRHPSTSPRVSGTPSTPAAQSATVGTVSSEGQSGGVTAGQIGSVVQGVPR